MNRYAKQLVLEEIDTIGQEKLFNSKNFKDFDIITDSIDLSILPPVCGGQYDC